MGDINLALDDILSTDSAVRLRGARTLSRFAKPDHVAAIQSALDTETVMWVKEALKKALRRATEEGSTIQGVAEHPDDDVYAQAVEEIAGLVVHELSPVLGSARLSARQEVPGYAESKTKRQLDRLADVLDALDTLSHAAAAPRLVAVDLADLFSDLARTISERTGVPVTLETDAGLQVTTDAGLLSLVIANAITNACEASSGSGEVFPVVVSWGETDQDVWVSVIDSGTGLPERRSAIFDIGSTTKTGHLGMGLAVAQRAAQSLRGQIQLSNRTEGGTLFSFRWPHPEGNT